MLSVVGSISLRGGARMTTKALGALITAMGVVAGGLPAEAQGPIRIGASLSLTGTYAKLGRNQHEGYKLCVKDLNAKGGLLGRKVELVVYDDQSTPATAVRLYEKLITEDRVDGVMGPYSSPVTEASVNVTEKYKKVMVAPLAATTSIFKRPPDKKRSYVFMVISPAEEYLEGLIDTAAKRGLKTVAIVNEDTLFSKAAASGAVDLAKKRGMQVVFQEAYPKGNTDFSALLTKVKALTPDVLAAATYFDDAVAVTRAGTLDADRVREQLLKLEMRTIFGEYKVDADGFQVAHKIVTFQWQEGRKVVVWPDELALAKPRFPTPPWNQR